MTLPVKEIEVPLKATLLSERRAILVAPPGSGKSTYLPLYLLKSGDFKRIIMLEPRRVAARNIAMYLASLCGEELGQQVGLRTRGETKVSKATRLEIVTEGVLTRLLQNDPELSDYDLVIFDEFHERSLQADMALAFTLECQSALREDLAILVMSATLAQDKLTALLDCPVIETQGKRFDVHVEYVPVPQNNTQKSHIAPWQASLNHTVIQAIETHNADTLVFLPGNREIRYAQKALEAHFQASNTPCDVNSLTGQQSKSLQQHVLGRYQWQSIAPNAELQSAIESGEKLIKIKAKAPK